MHTSRLSSGLRFISLHSEKLFGFGPLPHQSGADLPKKQFCLPRALDPCMDQEWPSIVDPSIIVIIS